jgi:hypothetical protein
MRNEAPDTSTFRNHRAGKAEHSIKWANVGKYRLTAHTWTRHPQGHGRGDGDRAINHLTEVSMKTEKMLPLARTLLLTLAVWIAPAQSAWANTTGSLYQAWVGALGGESQTASTPGGLWVALALVSLALIMRQIGKRNRQRLY